MSTARIALDGRFAGFAGIGHFVSALSQALVRQGADLTSLLGPGERESWLGEHAFAVDGTPARVAAAPFRPAEQWELPRVLRRVQADVYHSPHLAVPYAARVPVVLTVHDLMPYLRPESARSRAAASYYRAAFPLAVRRAQHVVTVSDAVRDDVVRHLGVPEHKVSTVLHGLDLDRFRPRSDAEVEEVRRRLGLPDEHLLYVGTTKPHKNLRTVLEALAGLPDTPPLVLVGPTPDEVAALGGPRPAGLLALGRVGADLPALYSGAAALLLPSLEESVGFPALEAMACGTPVLSSSGGGLPETVGDAGLLLPPTDVSAWRDGLTRLLGDAALQADLVARGSSRVAWRSWDEAARGYGRVYEAVA